MDVVLHVATGGEDDGGGRGTRSARGGRAVSERPPQRVLGAGTGEGAGAGEGAEVASSSTADPFDPLVLVP